MDSNGCILNSSHFAEWGKYQIEIIALLVVLLLLMVFIAALFFMNRRLKKMQAAVNKSEARFRMMGEEEIEKARTRLYKFADNHSLIELMEETINEVEKLTGSSIGFYHFVETDQNSVTLQNWSTRTKQKFCKIEAQGLHYEISKAGVWVDCVHQRKPVIHNDYASLTNKKGLPPGHATLIRELVVPLIRKDKVLAILGVGNKPGTYTETDIKIVSLFADFAWDLAERKQAEEKLRESEYRLQNIIDASGTVIFLKDLEGRYITVNRRFEELFHMTRQAVIGKSDYDLFPAEHAERFQQHDRYAFERGSSIEVEEVVPQEDGPHIYISVKFPILSIEGRPYAVCGIATDITARKQAEQEMQQLIEAVRQASEGVVVTRTDGTISFANPAFEQISGYALDELVGRTPRILKSGLQDNVFYKNLWETLLSGRRWAGRIINKRKDGNLYNAECSISPVKDGKGRIVNFVWMTRDITKELELEKRMAQAQKMEALGNLAGGIAHDFNNILFPIRGMSEILLEDLPAGSPEHEKVVEIHEAGKRAANLVNQILAFSRKKEHEKTPIRIQDILKEVLTLTRATIPSNIEINQFIQKDCGLVMADPTNVHQIAMNLITNAYHAVEKNSGTISIQLTESLLGSPESTEAGLEPGKYVLLSVADTGHGMTPEILGKIFEPYFTTKEQGKGTGLGLAVVFGIIKDHGGGIRMNSAVGKGSTFHVYLPLLENTEASLPAEKAEALPRGVERILLVDDEQKVVKVAKRMLERLGYQVVGQTGSLEALSVFMADPDAFDLVITDMAMPKMTGDELAGELMAIKPDLPVILCSGYSEKLEKLHLENLGIKGFLMKPIARADLAVLVRTVLDSSMKQMG